MTRIATQEERGSSLVIAILVLVILTLLGMTVLQAVNTETHIAGQNRAAESALHVAEAGVAWGMDKLRVTYAIEHPSSDLNVVLTGGSAPAVIPTNDPTWPDAASANYQWRELPGSPISFGGGTFRVAVSDDMDGDSDFTQDSNDRILLRSLGTDANGARRLIEAALMDH